MPLAPDPPANAWRRSAEFRFYEELNDFLPTARRKRSFTHAFDGTPAVKDVIESLGVPHTEIDVILVDGRSVQFGHRLQGGERVAVYPVFERFDVRPLCRLRARPLRRSRFIADVHLGALARQLRLLGFDTLYDAGADDATLASRSAHGRRILLTRDVGLLKRAAVTRGHWLRATEPRRQLEEVITAFSLQRDLAPFTRCTVCNGLLRTVTRVSVAGRVPPRVHARFRRFWECRRCGRIYWRGTHFPGLEALVKQTRSSATPACRRSRSRLKTSGLEP